MRFSLPIALIIFSTVSCPLSAEPRDEPGIIVLNIGAKQLFVDDYAVDELRGVRRTMHQVRKWLGNPVLRPEHPWEQNRIATRDAPLWNPVERRWEYYYFAHANKSDNEGRRSYTCLAVSKDGLKWEKPIVGLYEYQGSKKNNIAKPGSQTRGDISLFHTISDLNDPDPNRCYKGFIGERNPLPASSPDGLKWSVLSDKRIPSGEASYLVYDDLGKQYVATLRHKHENRRAVTLSTSKDFIHWTSPVLICYANERDQQRGRHWLQRHLDDTTKQKPFYNVPAEYDTQVYAMGVFPYEGLYVGLPTMFYHTGHNDGLSDVTLSVSRDLRSWKRVGDGKPFIPLSSTGDGFYDTA